MRKMGFALRSMRSSARKQLFAVRHSITISTRRRFVLLLFAVVICYILRREYAWSLIFYHRFISPSRKRCSLDIPSAPSNAPLDFGILMVFDERIAKSNMAKLSVKNKQTYANRHGYELVVVSGENIDPSRPAAWSKFKALAEHLNRFDYVLFVDVDALVMNFDVRLQHLVSTNKDIFITEDWNGLNTGVFIIRNSPWSHWFLKEAWGEKGSEQEYMSRHETSLSGVKYPFEFEQRAVHYIFQTSKWRERGLPVWSDSEAAAAVNAVGAIEGSPWDHSLLLPQCALNSYMLYPELFSWFGGASERYTRAQWIPGDFIAHMAGHKENNKRSIFEYCYKFAGAYSDMEDAKMDR